MDIYPQELQENITLTIQSFIKKGKTFKPTFLYIKQHCLTGKLYFGKCSIKKNPESYTGSGQYWLKHINKHNSETLNTLWYCLYYDLSDIVEFSLSFSYFNNIGTGDVSIWANLIPENGLSGSPYGKNGSIRSEAAKLKTKATKELNKALPSYKPHIVTQETRNNISKAQTGELNKNYGKRGPGVTCHGHTWTWKTLDNHVNNGKRVKVLFNGIIYDTIKEAALSNNKSTTYISKHAIRL